jgi:uracil-DNA glycosylase family protein
MKTVQLSSATPYLPRVLTVPSLQRAARGCEGCPLYERATQTVFGEGPPDARLVLVGEQPGEAEDREGRPFVGSAGKLLDRAIHDANLDRPEIYVTNAVKHFKWEERGKRRIHKKPNAEEIAACRPWLEAEIAVIKPQLIGCLGATAAQCLMGRSFRVTVDRGRFFESRWAPYLVATVHPSSLLRITEEEERHREYRRFVKDLEAISAKLREIGSRPAV